MRILNNLTVIFNSSKQSNSFLFKSSTLLDISNHFYDYGEDKYFDIEFPLLSIKFLGYDNNFYSYEIIKNYDIDTELYNTIISSIQEEYSKTTDIISSVILGNKYSTDLKTDNSNFYWSEEEDKILIDNYKKISTSELAMLLKNRTEYAISTRIRDLRLRELVKVISYEDGKIIAKYYPIEGYKCIKRLSRKYAVSTVKKYCEENNIIYINKSTDNNSSEISDGISDKISMDDKEIIKKFYPREGLKCLNRLNGLYTNNVIYLYCSRNNIRKLKAEFTWLQEEISIVDSMMGNGCTIQEIVDTINKLECNKNMQKSVTIFNKFLAKYKNGEIKPYDINMKL